MNSRQASRPSGTVQTRQDDTTIAVVDSAVNNNDNNNNNLDNANNNITRNGSRASGLARPSPASSNKQVYTQYRELLRRYEQSSTRL